MSKSHGKMTVALGSDLLGELWGKGYAVYYDHGKGGDEGVGVTSSWIGGEKKRDNRLAEIDIAITRREENKAILLVEIEESGDNPKKIIGAAIAILLGDNVSPSGQPALNTGSWTTLLVLAKGEGTPHESRTREIETRITQLFGVAGNNRLRIGRINLELFQDQRELKSKILKYLPAHE